MRLDVSAALARFRDARVARLATADAAGQPHLVPVTFAVSPTDTPLFAVIAIDHKPKSTTNLRRLRNITANARVSLLADHYDEDWTRLWWTRLDGRAEILTGPADLADPMEWLTAKYPQYRATPPTGPVIRIAVETVRGWAYSG
ncbi:TIGR03668 family PPOX class F420-dependent oxidoreductase [Nocardia yunnanensis]|uniref:TIGR03668 family PPOX class F420-dependent oxidoreductase n=1 Tax=Nocardia yunnanensis TaxID=2382165 RepID=A0A386ZCK5_9NOCA|nr:TIGR03668 family PPOX class F420-dependent oxidoreductase [Nocardia yunnanensis]AYF74844.1 TIGR03668 family PPOX class F420-dependent oxidoreductase [Nocardia yunnanensis]